MSWLSTRLKALQQLGPRAIVDYALHTLGVRSGYLRWRTPPGGKAAPSPDLLRLAGDLFPSPQRCDLLACMGEHGSAHLLEEADEIRLGQVRLFGGPPVPLQTDLPFQLEHWTAYEHGLPLSAKQEETSDTEASRRTADIKFTWEMGRFGWAVSLARAYTLSRDEDYAQFFWLTTEQFLEANPPNLGPHWASAQEVALRLIALVFCGQAFANASHTTARRRQLLGEAVASHAERIPPTLAYARAQRNNHLVSEAAGLYTASLALPEHPRSAHWRELGWHWLNHALQTQITPSGAYIQHSTNYHRLMLQVALWVDTLRRKQGQPWPDQTLNRLAASTDWLMALCDPATGQLPNLGPNDGALVLPLSVSPFADYRPTLQAASLAFLGKRVFPPGLWDELALWLDLPDEPISGNLPGNMTNASPAPDPLVLRATDGGSWAYLRAAHFTSRPGHADQLHLDLWWRGVNLAQDAGTYLYNAADPWENALAHSAVHNTLTVNGQDQMLRTGRFLYLDWAQAQDIEQTSNPDEVQRVSAAHNGYRRLGLLHRRSVESHPGRWLVEDRLEQLPGAKPERGVAVRLHWLLPDWDWAVKEQRAQVELILRPSETLIEGPGAELRLVIRPMETLKPLVCGLLRAGEGIYGTLPASPILGWASPTYGTKLPALSLVVEIEGQVPLTFTSEWIIPSG